jgi:hypothetical protein
MTQLIRIPDEEGQTIVLASVGMVAVVAMLLFVLNASVALLSYRALNRAAQDAATAALRSIEAGTQELDEAKARDAAEDVLGVEVASIRFLQEAAADVVATLDLTVHNPTNDTVVVDGQTYHGPVVEVGIDAHICPPVWSCVAVRGQGVTSMETTNQSATSATAVPTLAIEITPTPVP